MFYSLQFSFWYLFFGTILTYLVWGFIVSFEVNLAMGGSKIAQKWIRAHHTYKQLYYEVKIFYPIIYTGYFFLELLPHLLWKAPRAVFDMERLFQELFDGEER
ncbi:hypothetical protein WCX18_10255 [Sulfurimonas sp. HSL1-2]|uniref:hypothetical protein n=1 Tax=Thiomicrolovo zhangzhouensis TaxID=3131933 RepID=UPI0031FA0746